MIGINSSSNSEVIKDGGELFDNAEEIPEKLEKIVNHYGKYEREIRLLTIDEVGMKYHGFFRKIYTALKDGIYMPKRVSYIKYCLIMKEIYSFGVSRRIDNIKRRLMGLGQ